MNEDRFTLCQLNRATLARQMLLQRETLSATEAVGRLCGMQAQEARPPFVGIWSRLAAFERDALHRAYHERSVVRATLMRGALHAFPARDYLTFRGTLQPVLDRALRGVAARAEGIDRQQVVMAAREILGHGPRTVNELRPLLAEQFPHADERILGYTVRTLLPLVMIPTADRWAFPADSRFGLAEQWLGAPLLVDTPVEQVILRYLAAFGPASVADAQTWSGLQGLNAVFATMRAQLRVFRDGRGRELFDLPDAPRPHADTPAPPRFLPEFDNLLLSHADRRRILADAHRPLVTMPKNLRIRATFLLDGFVAGTWRVERKRSIATLHLAPFEAISREAADVLIEEGERLIRFLEEDAERLAVAVAPPGELA